jgi:transposase
MPKKKAKSRTTLTKKLLILSSLKEGLTKKDSAQIAGIDESTFYRWVNNDASFASRIEENILKYKHTLIKSVNETAIKDGKFALKVLERRWGEEWGIKQQVEPIDTMESELTKIADTLQAIYDNEDRKNFSLVS